jgi:hypothetical protein
MYEGVQKTYTTASCRKNDVHKKYSSWRDDPGKELIFSVSTVVYRGAQNTYATVRRRKKYRVIQKEV